jgi:hypothetical protein
MVPLIMLFLLVTLLNSMSALNPAVRISVADDVT